MPNKPATPEEVRNVYLQNIGREPLPNELAHHATNKTGLSHLQQWASQQGGQSQQKVGLGSVLTAMLKDFQRFNSSDRYTRLYKQNRELQEAQGMRSISPVAGSSTLSPSQRSAIQSGSANALSSQVTASADVIKGRQAATTDFLNAIQVARTLGNDMETLNEKKRDNALTALEIKAQSGQEMTPEELNELGTLTGWNTETLQSYWQVAKQKSDLENTLQKLKIANERKDLNGEGSISTSVVEVGGQKLLINSKTGETIKEFGTVGNNGITDEYGNFYDVGGKQLSSTDTKLLSDGNSMQYVLDPLYEIVEQSSNLFGPIVGSLGQLNPYAEKSKKVDDDLRRASQIIGRFMEGGVLRKEDEEKYRKMLPQLTDLSSVAKDKLDGVADLLKNKQHQYLLDFNKSGYDVSNYVNSQRQNSTPFNPNQASEFQSDLREQVIDSGYDYDQMKDDGLSDQQIKDSLRL